MAGLLYSGTRLAGGLLSNADVPSPLKLYWDSVVRGKKDPITEKDFSESELEAMRKLVGSGSGAVQYQNYKQDEQPGLMGLLSPAGRVANTLGQFNYQTDPAGTTISDNYDFNPVYGPGSPLVKLLSVLGTGGFSGLHMLGEKVLPEGSGRKVNIRLPAR